MINKKILSADIKRGGILPAGGKMRIAAIGVFLAALVSGGAFAVDWAGYPDAVQPGALMISAGIGYGTPLHGDMVVPPLTLNADYALSLGNLPLTFGALFGFTMSEYKWSDTYQNSVWGYTHTFTGIVFGATGAYHPDFGIRNLDAYGKLALGYYIFTGKAEFTGEWNNWPKPAPSEYSTFYYGISVGGRYFFTQAFGAYLELGYSALTYVSIGATFKTGLGSGGGGGRR